MLKSHHRILRALPALLCTFAIGCGPSGPTRLVMKFDVSRKANDDNPLKVDVVVAYDAELVDELDRLTANEWFDQREQRMRSNPGGAAFSAWRWELTPGLEVPNVELPLRGVPAQGIIYAGYYSRGKHSARFDPVRAQSVLFRQDAFRVIAGRITDPEGVSARSVIGWTAIALGAVGTGLGTFFAISSSDKATDASALRQRDRETYDRLVQEVEDDRLGMYISYGAGAVFLLTGMVVLLWPESDDSPFREIVDDEADGGGLVFRW